MQRNDKILFTYSEFLLVPLMITAPFVVLAVFCLFSIYFWVGLLIFGVLYFAFRKLFHKVIFCEDHIEAKSLFLRKFFRYEDIVDVRILRGTELGPSVVQVRFKEKKKLTLVPKSRLDAVDLFKVLRSKEVKIIKTEEYVRFSVWEKTKEMSDNDWT